MKPRASLKDRERKIARAEGGSDGGREAVRKERGRERHICRNGRERKIETEGVMDEGRL